MIVKPETLIGWHRKGFKLFWRWRSRLGRPRIPEVLRQLIVRMVRENPTWGEERIAAELSVKLGILVSPRTVRAYWPQDSDPRGGRRTSSQPWRTFVRNHAKVIVAKTDGTANCRISKGLAEREGFEPSVQVLARTTV